MKPPTLEKFDSGFSFGGDHQKKVEETKDQVDNMVDRKLYPQPSRGFSFGKFIYIPKISTKVVDSMKEEVESPETI